MAESGKYGILNCKSPIILSLREGQFDETGMGHTKFATDSAGSHYEDVHVGQSVVQFGTEDSPSMKASGLG